MSDEEDLLTLYWWLRNKKKGNVGIGFIHLFVIDNIVVM